MIQRAVMLSVLAIGIAAAITMPAPVFAMGPAAGGMGGMGMGGSMNMGMGVYMPAGPDARGANGDFHSGMSIDAGQLGLQGVPSAPTGYPPLPTLSRPTSSSGGTDGAQSASPR